MDCVRRLVQFDRPRKLYWRCRIAGIPHIIGSYEKLIYMFIVRVLYFVCTYQHSGFSIHRHRI